jgi:hypothetical protein
LRPCPSFSIRTKALGNVGSKLLSRTNNRQTRLFSLIDFSIFQCDRNTLPVIATQTNFDFETFNVKLKTSTLLFKAEFA